MVIILMGVSGSGKTTIGVCLAQALGWSFHDADNYHPTANIEKMRRGVALTDSDRLPWLQSLRSAICTWLECGQNAILACSALKASYRATLAVPSEQVQFVYLKGSFEVLHYRLERRHDHYMSARLLESQLATLEEPENALVVNVDQSPENILETIDHHLCLGIYPAPNKQS